MPDRWTFLERSASMRWTHWYRRLEATSRHPSRCLRQPACSTMTMGKGCMQKASCDLSSVACLFLNVATPQKAIGAETKLTTSSTAATATPKIQGKELPTAPHPWTSWASSKSWRPLCEPAPPLRGRPQSEDEMAVRNVECAHLLRRRLHGLLRGGGSITTLHYL